MLPYRTGLQRQACGGVEDHVGAAVQGAAEGCPLLGRWHWPRRHTRVIVLRLVR